MMTEVIEWKHTSAWEVSAHKYEQTDDKFSRAYKDDDESLWFGSRRAL